MDVSFVNPFIKSTVETFSTMIRTAASPQKPQLKQQAHSAVDVSGIIGLSGDAQGAITMGFPKVTALKVVSAFLGSEVKIVDRDVADAIGELANIVAGAAKQHLTAYNLSISLPRVVMGTQHQVEQQRGIPCIVVPFETVLGNFVIDVALKTK